MSVQFGLTLQIAYWENKGGVLSVIDVWKYWRYISETLVLLLGIKLDPRAWVISKFITIYIRMMKNQHKYSSAPFVVYTGQFLLPSSPNRDGWQSNPIYSGMFPPTFWLKRAFLLHFRCHTEEPEGVYIILFVFQNSMANDWSSLLDF